MIITKPRVLFDYKMVMNLFLRIMIVDDDVKKIHDDGDTYINYHFYCIAIQVIHT